LHGYVKQHQEVLMRVNQQYAPWHTGGTNEAEE